MGLKSTLARLAAGTPVRCFTIAGCGADETARWLRLDPGLEIVDSPRSAHVLLVLGDFDEITLSAVAAVHDSMPPPRTIIAWSPGGHVPRSPVLTEATVVRDSSEIGPAATSARDDLFAGRLPSTPDIRSDVDPAPWRGVGPFGQGGSGMTGGVPYGRPLAGRADDRDGLKLDQILVRVGPFLPPFPPGLQLDVSIQGDVIQEVDVPPPPNEVAPQVPGLHSSERDLFSMALTRPVLVSEVELARSRHHLVWLAELLRVCGLEAYGLRLLALARDLNLDSGDDLERAARWLLLNRSLRWPTRRVGVLSADQVQRLPGGPVARAAGVALDARTSDPTYQALGFQPVVATESDVFARWRLRLDEARQALLLAREAQNARTTPLGFVEGPGGPLGFGRSAAAVLLEMLPELLVGQEWGDAVMTVVSLDINMADARAPVIEAAGGNAA